MPWASCYGSQRVSAPHPRTLSPASSALQVCPDQIPMLLLTWLTLLLQPFTGHCHSTPCSGSSSRSSNKQASLLSAPISLSSSSAQPLGVQLCWLCGGPFSPLSFCTYWSLCPRAREQCARTQKEDGRRDLTFPPPPPGAARALCLFTALSGCT